MSKLEQVRVAEVYRSSETGAAVAVGPLEGRVLEILWADGPRLSVPEVHRAMSDRNRKISYSAVKAVLNNLAEKGWLKKDRLGKVSCFEVVLSREQFQERVARNVLASLKRNFGQSFLAQFIDEVADDATLDELERLLLQKKRDLRK